MGGRFEGMGCMWQRTQQSRPSGRRDRGPGFAGRERRREWQRGQQPEGERGAAGGEQQWSEAVAGRKKGRQQVWREQR